MKPEEVDRETVQVLACVAGIRVPDEDLDALVAALRNHLEGVAALDALDLDESDPIVTFDARWQ